MSVQNESYEALSGLVVLVSNVAVEQTGMEPGAVYEFNIVGGMALCRWDTTAAAASDGGFTFVIMEGETLRVKNPSGNTLLNVIEANGDSQAAAVLTITKLLPA